MSDPKNPKKPKSGLIAQIFMDAMEQASLQQAYMEHQQRMRESVESNQWAAKLLDMFAEDIKQMLAKAGAAAYNVQVQANYQTGEIGISVMAQYVPPDKKNVH